MIFGHPLRVGYSYLDEQTIPRAGLAPAGNVALLYLLLIHWLPTVYRDIIQNPDILSSPNCFLTRIKELIMPMLQTIEAIRKVSW